MLQDVLCERGVHALELAGLEGTPLVVIKRPVWEGVCVCVCMCVCVCLCVCVCICVCVQMGVCTCVRQSVCVYACGMLCNAIVALCDAARDTHR
jgi:hypothetical protein